MKKFLFASLVSSSLVFWQQTPIEEVQKMMVNYVNKLSQEKNVNPKDCKDFKDWLALLETYGLEIPLKNELKLIITLAKDNCTNLLKNN